MTGNAGQVPGGSGRPPDC